MSSYSKTSPYTYESLKKLCEKSVQHHASKPFLRVKQQSLKTFQLQTLSFLRSCADILQVPAQSLKVTLRMSFKAWCLFVDLPLGRQGEKEGKGREIGTTEQLGAEHQLTNREQNHITTLDQWTPRHSDKTDGHRQDIRQLLRKTREKKHKNPIKKQIYNAEAARSSRRYWHNSSKRRNYTITEN